MTDHPSLVAKTKPAEPLEEQLQRRIAELQTETLDAKERLQKIVELKETVRELQEQQKSLHAKEDQELDALEKEALELLIARLRRLG